jgi:hypothetical protein
MMGGRYRIRRQLRRENEGEWEEVERGVTAVDVAWMWSQVCQAAVTARLVEGMVLVARLMEMPCD